MHINIVSGIGGGKYVGLQGSEGFLAMHRTEVKHMPGTVQGRSNKR